MVLAAGAPLRRALRDRLQGCCLILREALHDPNLQVMLSAPSSTLRVRSSLKPPSVGEQAGMQARDDEAAQAITACHADEQVVPRVAGHAGHPRADHSRECGAEGDDAGSVEAAPRRDDKQSSIRRTARGSSSGSTLISSVLASSHDTFDSPNYCCMRLQLAHKLLLHGSTSASSTSSSSAAAAAPRRHPILAPVDALPLCADAIRSVDANVRQADAGSCACARCGCGGGSRNGAAWQATYRADPRALCTGHADL